jgi:hypothetical protein
MEIDDGVGFASALRAVARVRRLHEQYRGAGSPPDSCTECNGLAGYEVPWPCPTIQALDGAPADSPVETQKGNTD